MGRTLHPSLLLSSLLMVVGVDRSWAQPATSSARTTSSVSILKIEVRAITKIVVAQDSADERGLPIVYVVSNLGKQDQLGNGRLRPELTLVTIEEWHSSRGKGGDGESFPVTLRVARYSVTPP